MAASLRALRRAIAGGAPSSSSWGVIARSQVSWRPSWNRGMATNVLPESSDPHIKKALNRLYAINWYEIDEKTQGLVETALNSGKDGDVLKKSWAAALAVEQFYGTVDMLRKSIDDLMGLSGENTGPLPEKHQHALEAVHSKYIKYLSSFGEDEVYLKKKVELELGSVLILLKMRVSGLPPAWGDVGLLGTSGLSGSYIEKRA